MINKLKHSRNAVNHVIPRKVFHHSKTYNSLLNNTPRLPDVGGAVPVNGPEAGSGEPVEDPAGRHAGEHVHGGGGRDGAIDDVGVLHAEVGC